MRPYVTRLQRRQLATFDEGFAVAQMPWPAKFTAARELENRYADQFRMAGRRGFFARLLPIPGAGAIVGVNAAGLDLAARRVAIATLAVERYRRSHAEALPLSLDALVPQYLAAVTVDPFSGAPLVYKPSASGYVLYSIDTNLKDDDGAFYGIGSHNQLQPRQGAGRDLGIRVEYTK
jgi:hypothetical protein